MSGDYKLQKGCFSSQGSDWCFQQCQKWADQLISKVLYKAKFI